jgi:hypothetical protein
MLYRRRRHKMGVPGGFYRFQGGSGAGVHGYSEGEFIHLRDEFGNEWRGIAERQEGETIRYRFRDNLGNYISGVSDGYGVILRDSKGNTWRGFVD